MSKIAKSNINWKEIEKLVPVNQKANFIAFKGKSDGYLRRVLSNPPEPPKVDWDYYQKIVPVAGLVEKFKKEYDSYKVPYPEDTLSKSIDEQWTKLEGEIKKYCDEQQKVIDEAKKEIARINALPKFEDMTMEMYKDMFPNEALDPINRPTFWPHDDEEQLGYNPPDMQAEQKKH